MILIFLLKHDNSDSNIFVFQEFNSHLIFMALILWITKDQTPILISFLGVNRLFYVVGSSYPTTESSQNINSTTSTWFSFKDWTEIQGRVSQSKHHCFRTSLLSQKLSELPQHNKYVSQDKTYSIPNLKSPKTSCMSCHTTTLKILDMFIFSLMLIPTETHATTLDLFLTFLAQQKSYRQDSSHSVFLIKFCFYLFITPQNHNQTTFFHPPCKSSHLTSLLSHHNPLPSFLSLPQNLPFHLISLLPQNPLANLLKRFHWAEKLHSISTINSLCHDLQNNKNTLKTLTYLK